MAYMLGRERYLNLKSDIMKKLNLLVLVTFLFAIVSTSHGQISKGKVMLGTDLALSSTMVDSDESDTDDSDILINLNPKIGYFFADNFSLGLGIEYTYSRDQIGDAESIGTDLLAGPFTRYYIPITENSSFFAEASVVFGTQSVEEAGVEVSTTLIGAGIGPGITIFANDKFALEGVVRYNYISGTTDPGDGADEVSVSINEFDFLLGVQFYL